MNLLLFVYYYFVILLLHVKYNSLFFFRLLRQEHLCVGYQNQEIVAHLEGHSGTVVSIIIYYSKSQPLSIM